MLTRSESTQNKKNPNSTIIPTILRFIHFICKSYMVLGLLLLIVAVVLSGVNQSVWHKHVTFYKQYIPSDSTLSNWLTAIIISFFFSGFITLVTVKRETKVQNNISALPPHFYVQCDQFSVRYSIIDFRILAVEGKFHKKHDKEIVAWAKENKAKLIHEWNNLSPDGKLVVFVESMQS